MLLFKSGYYSNHVSLCMSTLNQAYVLTVYLKNQNSIQNRILFKTGFYSKQASIQNRIVFKTGFYSTQDSIQNRILFKTGFYSKQDSIQNRIFSAIFGLDMFGRKFVAAKISFCRVQCDRVYRRQQYRPKV